MANTQYRVRLTTDHICVQAPYKDVALCRAIPGGRYSSDWKCWLWSRTPERALALADAFGTKLTKCDGGDLLLSMVATPTIPNAPSIVDPGIVPGLKTTPWKHQREAYGLAKSLPGSMLAMGMGCIDGEAIVTANRRGRGFKITMAELHRKFHGGESGRYGKGYHWDQRFPTFIRSLCGETFGRNLIVDVVDSGLRETVLLTLASGKELRLTPDHEVLTAHGYTAAEQIDVGDSVLTNGTLVDKDGYIRVNGVRHHRETTGGVYEHIIVAEQMLGRPINENEHVHHLNGIKSDNRPENLSVMDASGHRHLHGADNLTNLDGGIGRYIPKRDAVVRVESGGIRHTYDVVCADPHRNFVANGIVVHNCGKTLTAIGLMEDSRMSIIICPKAVISVWPMEFAKHAEKMPEIILLKSGTSERKSGLIEHLTGKERSMLTPGRRVVVVVNYESAWRSPLAETLLKVPWNTAILDEIHKIKAAGGKASKFCARLRKVAARVVGLTGTPMPHSPVDLFAQYRALDPGIFGTNVHSFRQHYTITGGFGGHEVLGYKNQEEMRGKFLSIAYQADRSVIKLPPATHTVIPIELGAKAMKVYRGLAHDLHAAVGSGECTAANALVKLLRLQQLTGGYLKLDDGSTVQMDTEKREALDDILEGVGAEPVVVFCRFRSDLDAVHESAKGLGLESKELSGRANDLADWQKGTGQILAVQIQSGGVGVDLTRASYCVYYSLGFSLGDYEQSLARVHRPGQDKPVSYYHLIVEGTVDRQVYEALDDRRDVVNTILEGIKKEGLK